MRYAEAACPGQCDKPREEVNVPRANLRDATIVFDLDGTLVDTAPDLTNALNDALIRRGNAAISQATIRSAVGFGARVMIEGHCAAPAPLKTSMRCWRSSWCITR